jgi:O-antigen ligase
MINFARWFFLGILIYAPWAYGSTRPWTIALLNELLWACGILSVLGWLVERHRPRLPVMPLVCIGLLLLEACWMRYNARAEYDNSFWEFIYLAQPFPNLPGSWNKMASFLILQSLTGLALAFIITCDLVADRAWRMRLWRTIGLTGGSIIIFGLAQKALHAPSIFWLKENTGDTFFGAYRYHANAGAYLNLIWPILVVLTVQAWREKDSQVERAFWLGLLLLGLSACFVNISRGANGVTLLLLLPTLLAFFPFIRSQVLSLPGKTGLVTLVLLSAFIVAVILGGAIYQTQHRWGLLEEQINRDNPRVLVQQATVGMMPQSGWFGFGPGTFSTMFPYFNEYLGDRIHGFWVYAHEDYLQTVVEYGYVGAAIWSLFFFGGLARAIRCGFHRSLRSNDRMACRGVALALAGIALHCLIDFPLQVYSIQLYVMVFLAFAWTRRTTSHGKAGHTHRERSRHQD